MISLDEMVEKATPYLVKQERWMDTKCKCGRVLSVSYPDGYYKIPYENKTNYCPDCGQKLDWSGRKIINRNGR